MTLHDAWIAKKAHILSFQRVWRWPQKKRVFTYENDARVEAKIEPLPSGSRTPELLATQYKLHNLVFGLKSRSVRPSKCLPSWPGISVVE